jgi:uncharacterized surface protein with fasciclin (FAS1) repeats
MEYATVIRSKSLPSIQAVVYYLDTVLFPPKNIIQVASERSDLETLKEVVTDLGIGYELKNAQGSTILAPTNDAFEAASEYLKDLSVQQLKTLLSFHMVCV